MESELEKYRRKKRIESYKLYLKEKLQNTWTSCTDRLTRALLPSPPPSASDQNLPDEVLHQEHSESKGINWWRISLKLLGWIFIYMCFLKNGFGAAYFIISCFMVIWSSLGDKRNRNEPSAYSVFNPNCEAIDGTLKAEHLEKQLLFRN